MIISNPPFHDGLQTSFHAAEMLIRGATGHLHVGGKLRIVANSFLPYPALLDAAFGSHEVLTRMVVSRSIRLRLVAHLGQKPSVKSGR